jgi:sugar O-acyltransferase (sialic acid O-acetyltransferase NeuD family)
MNDIIIIGAGGFGREVEMLINQINKHEEKWNLLGYIDDSIAPNTSIGDSKVIGPINAISDFTNCSYVIAIADSKVKERISKHIGTRLYAAILIHPNVLIGKRVKIGIGTIICAGNIITEDISIGNHVILNLSCTVGHDTIIEDYSSFMPSVNISGEVKIGNSVFVGTGSKIINKVEIGKFTIIGAGAVVTRSIPANCTAVGVPAKPIIFHE